jgi:hypothetical protein
MFFGEHVRRLVVRGWMCESERVLADGAGAAIEVGWDLERGFRFLSKEAVWCGGLGLRWAEDQSSWF